MKPVIGLMPLYDDEKESYWMLPGYMTGIEAAGGIPIMLPLTDNDEELKSLADLCDGFLFTGGHDVSPKMYNCKEAGFAENIGIKETCAELNACDKPNLNDSEKANKCAIDTIMSCPARDVMEMKILQIARDEDKPVFGICRGIQFINAALGGTLYQDLPTQHPSDIEHHMSPPYDRFAHDVFIDAESPLGRMLTTEKVHDIAMRAVSASYEASVEQILAKDTVETKFTEKSTEAGSFEYLSESLNQIESAEKNQTEDSVKLICLGVNSYHHQAVMDLAPPLRAAAWSKDGIIEAVYEPGKKFLLAIQWHPEFDYKVNDDSMKLFRAFVEAASRC